MRAGTQGVCQICGAQFNGGDRSGGHCKGGRYGGCCQSFGSLTAFVKHWVGPFEPPGQRRCLAPDEMREKGWTLDDAGVWRLPAPAVSLWGRGRGA